MSITSDANSTFLEVDNAHLRVSGDIHATSVKVGAIEILPGYSLESTTVIGNTTSQTIQFTNTETSLVTSGDINMLHSSNNAAIKLNSNVVTEFPRSKKLIKYPRVKLTGPTSGGYTVETSNEQSSHNAWEAFDDDADGSNAEHRWRTNDNRYTDNSSTGTPSSPTGAASTYLFTGSEVGDWISVEFPEKMKLVYFTITGIHYHTPYEGVIYGYNTSTSTWERVTSFINKTGNDGTNNPVYSPPFYVHEGNTKYYSKYAMIVVKTNGHHAPSMYEWKLYGLPEYDPDADGVDVKVTSYPNIPNTDWLEVYYDAKETSSYTGSGATVTDISPNTNNGTLNGGVGFDSTYKAFTFNGTTTQNITTTLPSSVTGEYLHSVSLWVKADEVSRTSSGMFTFFTIGSASSANMIALGVNTTGDGIKYDFYNASVNVERSQITSNEWMHFVVTYSGGANNLTGAKRIYLNGKQLSVYYGGSSPSSPLSLTTSPTLTLGGQLNSSNPPFSGSIANFRLFNRAISSDEIYQLYAYQKEYFGHGDLSMTLKAGRLGIGTSEPKALLDVGGELFGPGSRPGFLVSVKSNVNRQFGASNSTHTTLYSSPLPIFLAGELKYNISNCLSFHDYAGRKYIKFTAPANGIYNFGLALGHTRNIYSQSDYIGFGLMVNKEGAYTTSAGSNYTELDYYFNEYEAASMFPVNAQITMNGNINIQLNKSDFVVYYSRSVANVELISTYSAWGHIVQYL